jgi:hypothetical protein
MRSEEEIKRQRDEISDWMDIIMRMSPELWNAQVTSFLVAAHDSLNWALGALPHRTESGIDFDLTVSQMRETMKHVKEKQHKHRDPLSN